MYHVYIIVSRKNGKKYTGFTRKSPEIRLKEHNQGTNTWTRQNGPFDLLYSGAHTSKHAAVKQEIYLKSAAGRKFLKKVLGS